MPKTYYDSELTAEQIEDALTAIDGVVNPGNNGKVLYIEDGKIRAASASRWSGGYPEPTGTVDISTNGLVNVKDYAEANVQVSGGGGDTEVIPLSVTANGTYTAPVGKAYSPVAVDVSGGSSDCYYQILVYDNPGTSLVETRYARSGSTVTLPFEYSLTIGGPSEGNTIQNISHNMTIYAEYETTYVQSADGKLGVLVYDDLTVLFFNGYTFPAAIVPFANIDESVRQYFESAPTNAMAKAYQSAESTEWYGNTGMYNGIRLLTTNNANYLAGTVYAVIEIPAQPGTTIQNISGAYVQMVNYVSPSIYRRSHN